MTKNNIMPPHKYFFLLLAVLRREFTVAFVVSSFKKKITIMLHKKYIFNIYIKYFWLLSIVIFCCICGVFY